MFEREEKRQCAAVATRHSHSLDHFVTELDTCECRKCTFPFIVDVESLLPVLCYVKHEKCFFVLIPIAKECPQTQTAKAHAVICCVVLCRQCAVPGERGGEGGGV